MMSFSFQARVASWMQQCFGPVISADKLERGDRLLEETLELLQSGNYPRDRVALLVDYVYGRPAGEPKQEVGGTMVTLAAYCTAHGLDMKAAGAEELARICAPKIVEKIRAKQALKAAALGDSPLPSPPPAEDLPPSLAVVPNIAHSEQTLDQLRQERDYWQKRIDTSTGWGASLGMAAQERDECMAWIEVHESQMDRSA